MRTITILSELFSDVRRTPVPDESKTIKGIHKISSANMRALYTQQTFNIKSRRGDVGIDGRLICAAVPGTWPCAYLLSAEGFC